MEWTDDGIVLGTRKHGEANAIVELLTRAHGRHLGLVRGGSASRLRPVLQPGNVLQVVWRARLDEHLGYYTVDALDLRAGKLIGAAHAVYAVTHLAALVRLLPERDPHESTYEALDVIFDHLDDPLDAAARTVRFELDMLSELGFGLDLSSCAATGTTDDLVYVSPKSGRAVSRTGGDLWKVRNGEDLMVRGDTAHGLAHLQADATTNASVDLIEDERRNVIETRQNGLEREHDTRELTA